MFRHTALLMLVIVAACGASVRGELVAHWKLDESAGTTGPQSIADSGPLGAYSGTPVFTGASPVTFGHSGAQPVTGSSADFNGLGGIDVPYDPALNPSSFTFSAWAFADATAGFQSVVTSRFDNVPALQGYILYNDSAGNWNFWTGRNGGWDALPGGAVTTGVWTHLAISFDASTNTKTIYVNGAPTNSTTTQSYVPNNTRDLHLGSGADFGTQFRFDGKIDDAALWNRSLDPLEITVAQVNGALAIPTGQVAHWALNEPAGTGGPGSVVDSTGNGHHGSSPAGPFALGNPGANANTGTAATYANGTIDIPYDPALNPESFTLTVWARPTAVGSPYSVVTNREDIGPAVNTRGFILYNIGGNWEFWTGDGFGAGTDGDNWDVLSGGPVALNQWTHLAITYDASVGEKAIYVNGNLVNSNIDFSAYTPNLSRDFHIGGGGDFGDQFRFQGSIDDVGLFSRALSQAEIQGIMANGVPEPGALTLGLIASAALLRRRRR